MTLTSQTIDTISTATLQQLMEDSPPVTLLDVRTGGEYETLHIPGSHNVPLDVLSDHVGDLAGIDTPVILVCQSGARAAQAHQQLVAQRLNPLHVLEGGVASWHASGGDVVHGDNARWAMDRQVRGVAGAIALSGILASTFAPRAKWVAGVIGGGLLFSAVSNTCAMGTMLGKLPYNQTPTCDVHAVLDQINAEVRL